MSAPALALVAINPAETAGVVASIPGGIPFVAERPAGAILLTEAIRRAHNSAFYFGANTNKAIRQWLLRLPRWSPDGATYLGPVRLASDGRVFISPAIHPALSRLGGPAIESPRFKTLSADDRARALCKVAVLNDLEAYQRGPGVWRGRQAVVRFVADRATRYSYRVGDRSVPLRLSVSSVYSWLRKYRAGGLDALAIDGRGRSMTGSDGGCSPDAIARYRELRHSAHRLSISLCFRMVAGEAAERGWRWFASDSACRAWDKVNIDRRGLTLTQGGELAFAAKAGPYLEPNPESFAPGEHFESDHTTLNCWAITKGGQIVRPVLTVWLDWRSRAIVGHTLCVTGNSDTILSALAMAAKRFGLPESCMLDNGKDFRAEVWTGGRPVRRTQRPAADLRTRTEGIFVMLGIKPRWAMPYSPNSKGRIERFFRTLDEQFIKLFRSYCGGRSDRRPEDHRDLVAQAIAWDELVARLGEWVETHNNSPHSGEGMAGRTPLQVMATAERSRPLTDEQATFLLAAWPRPVKIGRHGVAITIGGATLRFGACDAAIMALPIGTVVRLSYDPADLSFVNVWALDGCFLTRASENHRYDRGVSSEELRAAMREKRAAMRKLAAARKSGLAALGDPVRMAITAQARAAAATRQPDPPPPATRTLKPVVTPIEAPPKRLRRAVGSDLHDSMSDDFLAAAERWGEEQRSARAGRETQADFIARLAGAGGRA